MANNFGFVSQGQFRVRKPSQAFGGTSNMPRQLNQGMPKAFESEIKDADLVKARLDYLENETKLFKDHNQTTNLNELVHTATNTLYSEMQVVFAKAKREIPIFDQARYTLAEAASGANSSITVKKNTLMHLSYPMKQLDTSNGRKYFMRCKQVNPNTGQLSMHWACIMEKNGNKTTRYIGDFMLTSP